MVLWVLLLSSKTLGSNLAIDYSHFSGIVVSGTLGVQPKMDFALDFTSTETRVYSSSGCPPFVKGCYDPSHSLLTSRREPTRVSRRKKESASNRSRDSLILGKSITVPEISFTLLNDEFVPSSAKWRDVHGILGVGPGSSVFHTRMIEVAEVDPPADDHQSIFIPYVTEVNLSSDRLALVDFVSNMGVERWVIQGSVSFGPVQLTESTGELEINPSEPDIVLPLFFKESLPEIASRAYVDNRGRFWAIELESSLSVSPSGFSDLHMFMDPENLLYRWGRRSRNNDETEAGYSPYRIRFSSRTDRIVLGRPFLRSAGAIFFDHLNGGVGFLRTPIPCRSGFSVNYHILPIFGHPKRTENTLYFQPGNELILSQLPTGPVGRISFIRIQVVEDMGPETKIITRAVKQIDVKYTNDGIIHLTLQRSDETSDTAAKVTVSGESVSFFIDKIDIN